MESLTIRTSEQGWLEKYAKACKNRTDCVLVDDAEIGIDPKTQTILQMGKQARLSRRELGAVLVSLGMSGVGIGIIVAAIYDPEPTSKLGLLIAGGATCIIGGGLTAIRTLTHVRPPTVTVSKVGFKIDWKD
jgi:hypothetical protein